MIEMMQIFVLVLAIGWIARIARTRDVSPWLFGSVTVLGFLVIPVVVAALVAALFIGQRGATSVRGVNGLAAGLLIEGARWLWVGAIALYVSKVPGREKTQPAGRSSCRGCGWLNDAASLKCDACGNPYNEPRASTVDPTTGATA